MSNNIEEVHEYRILNKQLATLKVQAGFVEGVAEGKRTFNDITKMYGSIFGNNKEYCVILWNGIPFRLSYTEDLPCIIVPFSKMLKTLLERTEKEWQIDFKSNHFEACWYFSLDKNQMLTISGNFYKVAGGHEKAINTLAIVRIAEEDFLKEWKLLLEQYLKGYEDSGSVLKNINDLFIIEDLKNANNRIKNKALRYQYDKR
tara:strand:+ start:365694 stop:366299 length:606 start_codon:yes stop_codon:yes gene_type:complete